MGVQAPWTGWAAQIEGQFYPEKQTYLIGEPVFVVLDLANSGTESHSVIMSCPWLDTRFEAPTAPKLYDVSLFGCAAGGVAGSCGGNAKEIRPGEHYTRRYLLDGPFRLNAPGVYPIRAWHKIDVYFEETSGQILASQEIVSEFELTVTDGNEEELASVYAPILGDLKSADPETNWLARSAVVQNPPLFLESTILAMSEDPQTAADSILGLQRLATPRAKARLAKLCAGGNREGIRQRAITALGGLGDREYCKLMLDIAHESPAYSRYIALRAAGHLCGEGALAFLMSQFADTDHSSRFETAYALGNSRSREAVPLLIPLLLDPNPEVRRAARDSLSTLTHWRSKDDGVSAQAIYRDWSNWWTSNGASAPIYGIDECREPEPFQ